MAAGDFNADGKLDPLLTNGGGVVILLGNGNGTFVQTPSSPTAAATGRVAAAIGDLNGDEKLDPAVADEANNGVSILLGNGDATFTQALGSPIAVGNGPLSVATADFSGDAKLDLVVARSATNNITILLGNGDGTFTTAPASPATASGPVALTVGDFNGDGRLDLVSTNQGANSISLLLQP